MEICMLKGPAEKMVPSLCIQQPQLLQVMDDTFAQSGSHDGMCCAASVALPIVPIIWEWPIQG